MNTFEDFCKFMEGLGKPKEARGQIADYLMGLSKDERVIACNFMMGIPIEHEAVGYSNKIVETILIHHYGYSKSTKRATLGESFVGDMHVGRGLYIDQIHRLFHELKGASKGREIFLSNILTMFNDLEKRYFINILLGKLRMRVGMSVISHSLADIYQSDKKWVSDLYKKYESVHTVIGVLTGSCTTELTIGVPVKPQLAKDISKNMGKIEYPVMAEPKYDGSRAQVHVFNDGTIKIFSRSLKDKTKNFPDIVEQIQGSRLTPGIYDGEIYGEYEDGSIMPFVKYQHRINNESINPGGIIEFPVTIRLFDILLMNGRDYTIVRQHRRSFELYQEYPELTTLAMELHNEDEVKSYHRLCVDAGYEGIMLKSKDGLYKCGKGKTSWGNWYKLKTELRFDCLITGARMGEGDKNNVLSSFDISVLESTPESAQISFKSIGSVGGGFTMKELEYLTSRIGFPDFYDFNLNPIIIEVKAEKVMQDNDGKIALRFPQYQTERTDKSIYDIDTVDMVLQYI